MSIWQTISLIWGSIVALVLIYGVLQSMAEGERKASVIIFTFLIGFILIHWLMTTWLFVTVSCWLLISYLLVSWLGLIVLLAPWPWKKPDMGLKDPEKVDERNIMFSRAELEKNTSRFDEYYTEFPHHLKLDEKFRKQPGLLSKDAMYYHPFIFPAADASFYTVDALKERVDGPVNAAVTNQQPQAIIDFMRSWAHEMGCHSFGVTALKDCHLYSKGGRKHNYGVDIINTHRTALVFTVEMDIKQVQSAPQAPIVMESANQYLRAGIIAVQLASFLRHSGYSARAHIDGKYEVRCPQLARDAGLGELGRMSILMTQKLGPRVRIGAVTTELELPVDQKYPDASMLDFCERCKKCSETCPARAISSGPRTMINGALQWTIDQEACFTYWCKTGTDCGRCMSICPYSHPNNLMHNTVRFLIRTAPLFRSIAVRLDDSLYGRKPKVRPIPEWMDVKKNATFVDREK